MINVLPETIKTKDFNIISDGQFAWYHDLMESETLMKKIF